MAFSYIHIYIYICTYDSPRSAPGDRDSNIFISFFSLPLPSVDDPVRYAFPLPGADGWLCRGPKTRLGLGLGVGGARLFRRFVFMAVAWPGLPLGGGGGGRARGRAAARRGRLGQEHGEIGDEEGHHLVVGSGLCQQGVSQIPPNPRFSLPFFSLPGKTHRTCRR